MVLIVAEHAAAKHAAAQHHDGTLRKSTLEAVQAGRELAAAMGVDPVGMVAGADPGAAAAELARYLPRVLAVADPALAEDQALPSAAAVVQAAEAVGARAVVLAATRSGLSVAPRVACRLDGALLEDVAELWVDAGRVHAKRLAYLARVTETVRATVEPVVVTTKLNMFPAAEADATGDVESLEVSIPDDATRVAVTGTSAAAGGRVALDEADVVVTGGRGVGGPDGFTSLVEPLADALGGGVGSTRAAVDAGWRPYVEQIGQTGKTVAPNLYIALGVSGAVQHLSGMNRSKVVVAINKDPDAPIFKVSDYGIVGDVAEVVPALIDALKARS